MLEWCDAWGIKPEQIIYLKSDRSYCKEDKAQISHFLNEFRGALKGAHVLHDCGGAFKNGGNWILADGAGMHYTFPPAPHGELSVNDNNGFAIAKTYWRSEREKYCGDDFSKQALYLLYCIDWVEPSVIQRCWEKNFLLDVEKPSLELCDERLNANNRMTFSNQVRKYQYLKAYSDWLDETDDGEAEGVFAALHNDLDGEYWN